ncbi:MAG TPA: hypothetical protein VD962_12440 [Rubricoccaceae bacterium]|nr:hypothetical protein [Rubricoccaceae bacterium]
MTLPSRRALLVIGVAALAGLAAFLLAPRLREAVAPSRDLGALPAAALDALPDSLLGARLSLAGFVADQDDRGHLYLDDGTALVRVRLPEPPPSLLGLHLLVRGRLRRAGGLPLVAAESWHYDSTAAAVRSAPRRDRSRRWAW